jgi:hypothetical protein
MTGSNPLNRLGGHTVDRLTGLLLLFGGGLAGYGEYMHVTMGDRTLGNCVETGVCDPWDPQWVLAPLALGGLCLLIAALVAWRQA